MKILVDLQCCQTGSRYRGIGRYSMALLRAMLARPRGHDFAVVLNGAGGEWIESVRGDLDDVLSQDRIHVWQQPPSASPAVDADAWRRAAAGYLRESFIRNLRPDVVHVSSLFEGIADEAVVTIDEYFAGPPVAITHYDLIPYFYPDKYLPTNFMRRAYDARLQSLHRAAHFLAISEFSGHELIETLGVDSGRVTNISAGADSRFRKLNIDINERTRILDRFGLKPDFVLYTGGGDSRKNVANLIRAYGKLPQTLRERHQLVIVSKMSPDEGGVLRRAVREMSLERHVIILDYIPDDQLVRLYNLCGVFVLPSFHEGFGLPLLEAMRCGAPALGANRTSIPEVLGRDHALFNPDDVDEMSAKISRVLVDTEFANRLREEGLAQAENFSWARSAERALDALEHLHETARSEASRPVPVPQRKRTLAIIGELPFDSQAWKDYLEALSERYQITLVCRRGGWRQALSGSIRRLSANHFRNEAMRFDHRLYVIANERQANWVADLAMRYPGYAVLSEFSLSRMYGDPESRDALIHELHVSHGYRPLALLAQGISIDELMERFPCNRSLLQASTVIALDENDAALARKWYGDDVRLKLRSGILVPSAGTVRSPGDSAARTMDFLTSIENAVLPFDRVGLATALTDIDVPVPPSEADLLKVAECVVTNVPDPFRQPHIFVDMTELIVNQGKSGIQRVVRAIANEMLQRDLGGYRVEPVYSVDDGSYRYARRHTLEMLGLANGVLLEDAPIEACAGDIFLRLDLTLYGKDAELQRMRDRGVKVYELVYDLLPVKWPEHFVEGMPQAFHRWLDETSRYADGVICISKAIADEISEWLDVWQPERLRPLRIGWFHLGADIENAVPTKGLSAGVEDVLADTDALTFLMVGTIEPRKAYRQVLDAFEHLWESGSSARLAIVGRAGWLAEDVVARIENHPERGGRLFWLQDVSDEALLKLYRCSSALIMASDAEGFGLPLVEAARHGIPLIARDLPVFREVARDGAYYFKGRSGEELAEALRQWMLLYSRGDAPRSERVEVLDWGQSLDQLLAVVLEGSWYRDWRPGQGHTVVPVWGATEVFKGLIRNRKIHAADAGGLVAASRPRRVPAGRYELRFVFDVGQRFQEGTIWYDVVHASSVLVLQTQRISGLRPGPSGHEYTVPIELTQECEDLQFRFWAGPASDIALVSMTLIPAEPLPGAGALKRSPATG